MNFAVCNDTYRQLVDKRLVWDFCRALSDLYDTRGALKSVFQKWGHIFATEVVLGGKRLLCTQASNVDTTAASFIAEALHKTLEKRSKVPLGRNVFMQSGDSQVDFTNPFTTFYEDRGLHNVAPSNVSLMGIQKAFNEAMANFFSVYIGGDVFFQNDLNVKDWEQSLQIGDLL